MVRPWYGHWLLSALAAALAIPAAANAAAVTKQVYVTFDGSLAGTAYTLGAGELDNSGTFVGNGGVSVAGGIADVPGDTNVNSGFYFSGTALAAAESLGTIVSTNWISEALFSPDVAAASQPTAPPAANHILDVQGDTFMRYDGFCCGSPKVFDAGYWDGSSEGFAFGDEPAVGAYSHLALVWDAANTSLEAYVNGTSIGVVDQNAYDTPSPNIGYGFFARTGFLNRAVDGKFDAIAFSTFTGDFDASSDFQLPVPEPSACALLAIALAGLVGVRKK